MPCAASDAVESRARQQVVVDTNVFVAAGFRDDSAAASVVRRIADGKLRMRWNEATRSETRSILARIPPLDWERFEPLFRRDDRHGGPLRRDRYEFLKDSLDREFLALAEAVDAVLVTNDRELLLARDRSRVNILSPGAIASARG